MAMGKRRRRTIRGARGRWLLRLRGERLERPFAHLYETGGMRRVYIRGHRDIRRRLLIHTAGSRAKSQEPRAKSQKPKKLTVVLRRFLQRGMCREIVLNPEARLRFGHEGLERCARCPRLILIELECRITAHRAFGRIVVQIA
jgi:hypothetical protein